MKPCRYLKEALRGTTVIDNVNVVTETEILEGGSVVCAEGIITAVSPRGTGGGDIRLDGRGCWLLPGFIDLHGDALENAIAPRPMAPFPLDCALPAFDAELTVHGITTMYCCVAFADLGSTLTKPLRTRQQAMAIIDALRRFQDNARTRLRIHLRYEVLDTEALDPIRQLIEEKAIDLLSIMDHTPGFGVFPTVDAYRAYRSRSGGSAAEIEQQIAAMFRLREAVDFAAVHDLIRSCHARAIPTASHDDHTADKVRQAAAQGIGICEFPINADAARAAGAFGLQTVFGASNLVRDQSHAGNVLASDMLRQGLCDIICSDYAPMAMLQGLFKAREMTDQPFPNLVRLFSLHPARAVGLGETTGSIRVGKAADLILVSEQTAAPRVIATLIDGIPVFTAADMTQSSSAPATPVRDGLRTAPC